MVRIDRTEIRRRSALLQSLPEPEVEKLLSAGKRAHFDRGATLFIEGETATTIHIVIDGWIKLYRISPNGSEAVVNVFTRGGSFGEAVALRGQPYPVSAEAVTDAEVLQIPADTFISSIKRDPAVAISVIASTFQHLRSLVGQIEQMKAQTGTQRVAEFLLDLCPQGATSCVVALPYDKVLIAGRLGLKPESLSRAFAKLREYGVLIDRHHAAIENIDRLRGYVEEDPAAAWNRMR